MSHPNTAHTTHTTHSAPTTRMTQRSLGQALTVALNAKAREKEYGDGREFLNRRNPTSRAFIYSDTDIIQAAVALAPCGMSLSREAAITHILRSPYISNGDDTVGGHGGRGKRA